MRISIHARIEVFAAAKLTAILSALVLSLSAVPGAAAFQEVTGDQRPPEVRSLDDRRVALEHRTDEKEEAVCRALLITLPARALRSGEKMTSGEAAYLKEIQARQANPARTQEFDRPSASVSEAKARYQDALARYRQALALLIRHGEEKFVSEADDEHPPRTEPATKRPSPATILYSREGIEALRKSAELGYLDSIAVLGLLTLGGNKDVTKNEAEGTRLMLQAAAKGHADAQLWVGMQYSGLTPDSLLPKNCDQAIYWLAKAAEHGSNEHTRFILMGMKLTNCQIK